MAMIAVNLVLQKLATMLDEEARLLGGIHQKVDELRDDLESMKAFLLDAEARSENDEGVRIWVKQVRDVAYDTEDVLDVFLLCLSIPHGNGFFHSLRRGYHYIRQLRTRHRLARQIQQIKLNVKAISERRAAFCFRRIDEATSSNSQLQTWHDPRLGSLFINEADVVGIENPRSLLITWLTEGEQNLTAISVVGMGGLGKTTLVKKAYDSHPVKKHFDCQSWITVSKSFTTVELLRAALEGFLEAAKEPIPEGIGRMGDLQLVNKIRNHLQQKRYVVVFDDVWSISAWEAMKFALPDCNRGSRIVFTTRIGDVAASIDTNVHVYHLQPLSDEEAWTLFCMKAFRGKNKGVCPDELVEMSRSILKKCGGLPLAIVTIGGLLSKKNKQVMEWKKVNESIAAELKCNSSLENLQKILLLSYNDLPYYLKFCYLYLSVFPEDYLIKRMKLVRLWVVERFVEEKLGLTMEEVAEDYLNELVSRSMIQVVQMDHFNRVRTCRVHDLMRELIQIKSTEESLVMILDERRMTLDEKIRRLSIHGCCEDLSSDRRFPCLRSLLVFRSIGSSISSSSEFYYGFRLLRVLELEYAPLYEFPPELVKLIHLRYLSLRNTCISELPKSIGKLKNLEILDLKGSFISSLPVEILQLEHLVQLRNLRYRFESSIYFPKTYGMTVPAGIGRLTSLQKLGSVEVNGNCEIVEFGKLTQLRRLGILQLRQEDGINLCSSLEKMKHLTGLYMVSINTSESLELLSLSSPPPNLQRLFLKCRLPSLPGWIPALKYLTKLVLQYSNLTIDPLKSLQRLPNLVVLELRQAYIGEELQCEKGGYPILKKLSLCVLAQLKCLRVADGAMPGLRELEIVSCSGLEMVPLGIENLSNLQALLLWDMPYSFLKRIEGTHGEDFWKVQHIPKIMNN
ncbi:disease resistance protein RPM1-like [Cornus florida]|uniref:disease resistance protein RPM1-like n=1 Tax=Cornus florida TaxID=4283 RepID=UPI00289940FD|nr:disease resistance protein RPM1-like [Cornus florida]